MAPWTVLEVSTRFRDGRRVLAADEQIHRAPGTLREGEIVRLVLREGYLSPEQVPLRVVGWDGSPVPLASARLVWVGNSLLQAREETVVDGEALLRWPDEGASACALEVYAARAADGSPLTMGSLRRDLPPDRPSELAVRLPPEAAIAGHVVGPDGSPASGLPVIATRRPLRGPEPRGEIGSAVVQSSSVTDRDGSFRLGGLGAGEYLLQVAGGPDSPWPAPVFAQAGEDGIRIRLRSRSSARVRVLDDAGLPLRGATVSAVESGIGTLGDDELGVLRLVLSNEAPAGMGEARRSARTDASGWALLKGVDPASSHLLSVGPPRDRADLLPAEISPWDAVETTVRLEKAWSIEVRTADSEGEPVASVQVEIFDGRGTTRWRGETDEEGVCTAEGLPAGPLLLRATPPGEPPPATMERAISGDQGIVRLRVDARPGLRLRIPACPVGSLGWKILYRRETGGEWEFAFRFEKEGVEVVLAGLEPDGRYEAIVVSMGEGKPVVWRGTGLVPGRDPVSVVPGTGRAIRGRLILPSEIRDVRVGAGPEEDVFCTAIRGPDRDGTFELHGLPEGRLWICARGLTPSGEVERGTWIGSGDAVTLDLR
jgi:hypothetical protein